ncbi:MAG: hypothetical protein PHR35_22940 [Kiritimatiellae bacterium]|nr:hypothetical protein [Kiritimatiellia bacterium]
MTPTTADLCRVFNDFHERHAASVNAALEHACEAYCRSRFQDDSRRNGRPYLTHDLTSERAALKYLTKEFAELCDYGAVYEVTAEWEWGHNQVLIKCTRTGPTVPCWCLCGMKPQMITPKTEPKEPPNGP